MKNEKIQIPDIIQKERFRIELSNSHEFNIENIKQYDITNELKEVLIKYGFFKS